MIASYVKDNHRNWDKWLPEFRFAVNTAWQESIGFTPAEIALGRKLKGPLERALTRPPNPCDPTYDTVERHENLIQLVKENVQRAQAKQGHYYNLRRKQTLYKEGDLVWVHTHPLSKADDGFMAKLSPKWKGPAKAHLLGRCRDVRQLTQQCYLTVQLCCSPAPQTANVLSI
ncbi:piezo-type mechanosensitive ion channel component 2-like protein [Labeo rohita]|uniref:Piezo-type mechanosensitive ion channel component 2-like protein n=1 Tax=Labeo rohita TaxID=84645 RepID=A0A498NTW4_LABRO|nr:piezo-type mechanosensitive ion channel component 2-like protein [Labeo rohita]